MSLSGQVLESGWLRYLKRSSENFEAALGFYGEVETTREAIGDWLISPEVIGDRGLDLDASMASAKAGLRNWGVTDGVEALEGLRAEMDHARTLDASLAPVARPRRRCTSLRKRFIASELFSSRSASCR